MKVTSGLAAAFPEHLTSIFYVLNLLVMFTKKTLFSLSHFSLLLTGSFAISVHQTLTPIFHSFHLSFLLFFVHVQSTAYIGLPCKACCL